MIRVITIILITLIIISGNVLATPKLSVISTASSALWFPAELNKKTCKIVDDYLADHYFAVVFDGTKTENRKDLAKKIGQAEDGYVIFIDLRNFYDPPYTKARLASDIKSGDTVATILIDYSLYIAPSDKWVTGRVVQRSIFRDSAVPVETACPAAIKQALPKLTEQLDALLK